MTSKIQADKEQNHELSNKQKKVDNRKLSKMNHARREKQEEKKKTKESLILEAGMTILRKIE